MLGHKQKLLGQVPRCAGAWLRHCSWLPICLYSRSIPCNKLPSFSTKLSSAASRTVATTVALPPTWAFLPGSVLVYAFNSSVAATTSLMDFGLRYLTPNDNWSLPTSASPIGAAGHCQSQPIVLPVPSGVELNGIELTPPVRVESLPPLIARLYDPRLSSRLNAGRLAVPRRSIGPSATCVKLHLYPTHSQLRRSQSGRSAHSSFLHKKKKKTSPIVCYHTIFGW